MFLVDVLWDVAEFGVLGQFEVISYGFWVGEDLFVNWSGVSFPAGSGIVAWDTVLMWRVMRLWCCFGR